MKIPNTRNLFVFSALLFTNVEIDDLRITVDPTKHHDIKQSTKDIRNNILKRLREQYNISKSRFQSELLDLHCEVDNYKLEKPIPKTNYKNYHNFNYNVKSMYICIVFD